MSKPSVLAVAADFQSLLLLQPVLNAALVANYSVRLVLFGDSVERHKGGFRINEHVRIEYGSLPEGFHLHEEIMPEVPLEVDDFVVLIGAPNSEIGVRVVTGVVAATLFCPVVLIHNSAKTNVMDCLKGVTAIDEMIGSDFTGHLKLLVVESESCKFEIDSAYDLDDVVWVAGGSTAQENAEQIWEKAQTLAIQYQETARI